MLVVLGVTGGFAAYKAAEIVRGLDRAGAEVQVILTAGGARFITPLTLATLSRRPVFQDAWELDPGQSIQHVDLGRRAAALVVAPATANVLGKMAHGIADDLLSTTYLATVAPVVLAPAMNSRMWAHPATRTSVEILRGRGHDVVDPATGWLAEGEIGWGRMAEPERIVEAALAAARRSSQLAGRTVLVSAGPTREPIDPVRFVSNRSTGRMGYALAEAAACRGARVILVSGPVALPPPHGVERVPVETAAQMRDAILRLRAEADAVFMAAAVVDHALAEPAPAKIKRGGGPLTLELGEGPDILAELGRSKGSTILVGFAAETHDLEREAQRKLREKNLDFLVANDVARADVGFATEDNEVLVLDRAGGRLHVPRASKRRVAEAILDRVFGETSR